MYFKVNLKKLDSYSHILANNLCLEHYEKNTHVSGNQILKFTNVEQINLFIIFHIFETWKESSEKLKSPYFNYENKAVIDAYNKYINVLSQNIILEKDLFQPLLRKAIFETLYWIVAPEDFINYQYLNGKVSSVEKIKTFSKYVRINKILVEELIAILIKQPKEKFPQDELVWHFSKIYEANQIAIHEPAILLQEISTQLNFEVSDILPGPQAKLTINDAFLTSPIKIESTAKSEIETNHGNDLKIKLEKVNDIEKKTDENVESSEKTKIEVFENKSEEIHENKIEVDILREKARSSLESADNGPRILNQTFSRSQLTLNDVLMKRDDSLNRKLSKSKVTDIRSAIPLNKKFQFISSLFDGETVTYNSALSEVENVENYNQAIKILQDKYASKFQWKIENPSVEEFYEIIERRFL